MKVDVREIIESVRDLRAADIQMLDEAYWIRFIDTVAPLCLADGALLLKLAAGGDGKPQWAIEHRAIERAQYYLKQPGEAVAADIFMPLIPRCLANDFALSSPKEMGAEPVYLLIKLWHLRDTLLLLRIPTVNQARISEALLRAQLVADIPQQSASRPVEQAKSSGFVSQQNTHVFSLLHLLIDVYQSNNFNSAAYALVNGLVAASEQIDQAVLGWQEGEYVRIKTISHYDRFEKKTEIVKYLESALEEAADQRASIHYPKAGSDPSVISLAHKQLKMHLDAREIFTFPLYDKQGEVQASLMLVSWHQGFSDELLDAVNFISSLLFEPLAQQKYKKDVWFIRATRASKSFLSLMLGRQYVWTKVTSILIFSFILWGLYSELPHRVNAVAQMVTDSTQLLSAPYDGHLAQVLATSGDIIVEGDMLAKLDIQELMLQLAELQAEQQRAQGEVDKARATVNLIDTKIAQARLSQVSARIKRTEYFLSQADIIAPFNGVIVDGERQELMGAPVRKGQVIYRMAKIEGLYLLLQVQQEDIDFVKPGSVGELALISQPDVKYPFSIEQIIPMARIQGGKGAHFEVKARFLDEPQVWWRPGMTGAAKIEAGEKMAFWVLGHKLLNRLRMFLWW